MHVDLFLTKQPALPGQDNWSTKYIHHVQAITCFILFPNDHSHRELDAYGTIGQDLCCLQLLPERISERFPRSRIDQTTSLDSTFSYHCNKEMFMMKANSQSESIALWERYAVIYLHGQWSSGCCNFGCTNMCRSREAALETWLCSGCRRARYYCSACQKSA